MSIRGILILTSITAIIVAALVWTRLSVPKLAYIKSARVVENYAGMKEAQILYKEKMNKWKENVDTLQQDYQKTINKYNSEFSGLSKKERAEREDLLKKQEMNIRQYVSVLDEKAKEEDLKMTEGVINQINSYIKEYGEKHGYDLILGVTMDGSVLYGKDAIDVTDEVLKGLNENYKKGSVKSE